MPGDLGVDLETGLIGIGSMGGMLVRVLLRSGALAAEDVWAANRSPARVDALAAGFAGIHIASAKQLAANCDLIFLCVGASDAPAVLAQMDGELYPGQLLVTIAAAIPLKTLENRVPCRVAKLIPSITQAIGAGITLLMYGSHHSRRSQSAGKSSGPHQPTRGDYRITGTARDRTPFGRPGPSGLPVAVDGGRSRAEQCRAFTESGPPIGPGDRERDNEARQ